MTETGHSGPELILAVKATLAGAGVLRVVR